MIELTKQQKTFITNIQKKIGKTIYNHKLIADGDKILVGLSGGKDSMILLDALAARKNAVPYKYSVIAAHINVTNVPYEADIDFMQEICNYYNIKFHKIDITLDLKKDPKLSTCFICSWHRRTELFKLTNRLNCNKLAFGHHLDDAIETLLMNMAFNAEISAMPYSVDMFNGKFQIIRPMLDIEEKYFIKYAKLKDFNREIKTCPYAKVSKREIARNYIKQLEKINKDVRRNLFKSMNKIVDKYMPTHTSN
jgi:tRNA(Ile)-lysidine synthase TilS/MesJ